MPSCVCHDRPRTVEFTSSLQSPVCWCGLIISHVDTINPSAGQIHSATQGADHKAHQSIQNEQFPPHHELLAACPKLPVIINAMFWKARAKDIFRYFPALKDILKNVPSLNSRLYFLSNYLVGRLAGRGTFSKARQGLRIDPQTGHWTPVALKVNIMSLSINSHFIYILQSI